MEGGGDVDHGWAAIWATGMERGGNGAGARAAACLGGDPGDGDFVQTGADVETAWMR